MKYAAKPTVRQADSNLRILGNLNYKDCQKFFLLKNQLEEPKSPLTPRFQRGELSGITSKVPLWKRGI